MHAHFLYAGAKKEVFRLSVKLKVHVVGNAERLKEAGVHDLKTGG